jgi:uroporphyrinogen-III synthase
MRAASSPQRLAGWYVISLRPPRVLALSPLRIEHRVDAATRDALRAALAAGGVVFTSPNAVRAASALQALQPRIAQAWLAVGAGTAAALRRAGVAHVGSPSRMDSDGLLGLPALRDVAGRTLGLVTAPGGRDLVAATLHQRGADIARADVYARVAAAPAPRALARLRALDAPLLLALSSGEALAALLAAVPGDARALLQRARVVAASERLASLARHHGCDDVVVAASARPRDLLAAAAAAA